MFSKEVSGVSIPVVGFGTYKLSGEEAFEPVLDAVEMGYRHIDTAEYYDNEKYVGRAIEESSVDREEIFLVTKVWKTNLGYRDVKESFMESLDKLESDYVDLLLIHWPNPEVPLNETIRAFNELQDDGYVRNIGVSNFDVEQLDEAIELSDYPVIVNQVEYNPYENKEELIGYCQEKGVILTAYSPLAKAKVVENDVLNEIGNKHNKSPAQVSLRWLIQQKNVVAIPKAKRKKHRRENIDIFDFELTKEEMNKINQI